MLLFKTSGKTFNSVISNQKHAFKGHPKDWETGEIVLVSKNKSDCKLGENQIQYIMRLDSIRKTDDEEFEIYWPNNNGRWKYIAECFESVKLQKPFDVLEIVGQKYLHNYGRVQNFKKISSEHENLILIYLKSINALD